MANDTAGQMQYSDGVILLHNEAWMGQITIVQATIFLPCRVYGLQAYTLKI